ncbi:glycosyltransferase [Gangjinia marincola]|uniref:Glycosyltransferase n=1 Tax=Gangjinia marincola TaxID=578463 RepID=A0ABP3XX87_9FLAO
MTKAKILVAPLNWGLGHATRCVPIIHALLTKGFAPILASDGQALLLLQKEFPQLKTYELPSYNISYPKNPVLFKAKMLWDSPKLLTAIKRERSRIDEIHQKEGLSGIIADNRLGVRSNVVPSVIMTHQLNVLSGNTSFLSTSIHQHYIAQFDECWVPDVADKPTLSGKLGHLKKPKNKVRYLGVLSRLSKRALDPVYDIMVLLSGPEPQRNILEAILFNQLKEYKKKKVLFVKGVFEPEQKVEHLNHITVYNFLTSRQVEQMMNQSDILICRSGYTTLMDLAKLDKKALLIPTPGQYEQEYLAKRLKKKGILPYCKQDEFTLERLANVDLYQGLSRYNRRVSWDSLFVLFKGK